EPLSQRRLAEQISKLPEVQEVHIITGDWDILMKVKDKNVDAIGKFVIDKLRTVKGIQKTLTCMVFHTEKESSTIMLETPTKTRW
ncbi:MAG: Lrp/AsnC ligand binding domain-containing protein, partial [Candidatus Bathyarchaeota archaeon]|nr:Lrp/AsnC ligand binding domain-containing protein [Candidatus Bathyarchaeota archaeon]